MKFLPNLGGPGRSLSGFVQRRSTMIFIMRVSVFYVALLSGSIQLLLANPGSGQKLEETYVTVELNNESLQTLFTQIEKQTDLLFTFPEAVKGYTGFNLPKGKRSVKETLDLVLEGTPITFRQINSNLIAVFVGESDGGEGSGVMQNVIIGNGGMYKANVLTVTGTVKDAAANEPLAGVNVIVKGTVRGTTTDAKGKFSIDAEDSDILIFSFIGYKSIEAQVNGRSLIDVTMEEDIASLNEVIVNAGYYKVKDREQTGNISRVSSEELQKQPISDPLQGLEGRMPGVYINQDSGLPGGSINIQIRGRNSLRTDGNNPLYVINGVPYTSTTLSSPFLNSPLINGSSPLININPADIESIEVLKDADATAIYGSRGANGVILITTKKGKSEKTTLDINFYQGIGKVGRKLDLLNTQQYVEMRKEAYRNDGFPIPASNTDLFKWDTTRYTDWQKELIGGTAHITNAQASISGGDARTQFLFGTSYYKESTVFPGNFSLRKASGYLNISHTDISSKFKSDISVNYVVTANDLPFQDLTRNAITIVPNAPSIYNEANDDLNWAWANPYAIMRNEHISKANNLITNASFSYIIMPGLQAKSNFGYTFLQLDELQTNPIKAQNPNISNRTGYSSFADASTKTWIIEPQLDYNKTIAGGTLSVTIGTSFQESIQESESWFASGFTSDALIKNMKASSSISLMNTNFVKYRYQGGYGRINYNWKDKYLLNFTGRRDGSSRFGPDKQFSNFGAVGTAWIISNEGFIQRNLQFLSFAKLRASFGTTGSDQILDYGFLDTYSSTTYPYQNINGLIPTGLANADYAWETNKKIEAAFELGLFEDRLMLSSSWYRNTSSNQLVGYPLSGVTGFNSVQYNLPATVQNTGWEFELLTHNIETTGLKWTTSLNFTIPRNKLVRYPNLKGSTHEHRYVIGEPLGVVNAYHYTGVDPETGLYTTEDVDGDGQISWPNDLRTLEKITQSFFGGISNTFHYKRFQIDIFFQFVKQTGYNYLFASVFGTPGTFTPSSSSGNQPSFVMRRWQQSGDITDVQKFTRSAASETALAYSLYAYGNSDGSYSDASFIRLKNISISWQFPSKWNEKLKLENSRIYIQGQNLLTITDYTGMDPENQNVSSLPPLRVLTAGLQFTF
jgi:TonB-linked SusC/RagA family outer membrane protein